jgi:DNA-binding MarR family transcriptional regulator
VTNLTQTWTPLPALLDDSSAAGFRDFRDRLAAAGHPTIRPGHGCVFRFINEDGSRLTDLAERSGFSKQAVGEVVAELEGHGYVERATDPEDRRAKVIKLTDLGADAQKVGREIFAELERDWADRFGADRIAAMRELLEEMTAEPAG